MDVRLTPEQQALRDSVARVVDRLGPRTVTDLDDRERAGKLDAAIEASGWRELRASPGDGRPWASGVEVALVGEELGRGLADAAFVGPTLAADLRRLAGGASSTVSETVALGADLGEPGDALAVDAAGSTAALSISGHDVLSHPVTGPVAGLDLTRPAGAVGVASAPVGTVRAEDLDRWTALGLTLASADLVGTMRGALELGTGYAKERRQYGVPIGSFQAVQHLLADAHVSMEGSRSIARHAAWAVDALAPPDALAAAAAAKAYCARAARTVCETVIQVHGGIGHTWEHVAHVFLRRALLSIDLLGGVGPNLERVLAHHGIGGGHGLR
jgi:alkylation response protein AidB-like acyl-CoA dehydrogenase